MDTDPVTIEVLNNRLHQISREAGATLTRTAASPVTVEAKDLGFNITTAEGENIVFSVWMPRHGTTLSHMVKSTIDQFEPEDIQVGDMFLTNDPYAGALHIMDVAVLSPVHYDGELVAWTGCATHHVDIGAMNAGWPSRSTDWYQEGVKYPPIKVMEGGEIRDDVFELFLRNVRMPDYQGLDLKAQIASNTVARRRIRDTIDEYGLATLRDCFSEMIEYGEQTAQERIEALPNGEYSHTDYLDFDDVYRLHCTLSVEDERITFDFDGTDEQAPSFINCAYPCAEANLHNAVQTVLFPEATVNAGTFQPIGVEIPEGTIFNCTPPNPCGGASIYAGWRVMSLTIATLSKCIAASDEPNRASAEWGGGMPSLQLSGQDPDGNPYTAFLTDTPMLGGGARIDKDGVSAANVLGSTNTSIPNVEFHEQRYPIRYLERGLRRDSGGAGRRRGGLGGTFAFTPYGVDEITVNPFQHRRDSLPFGLFGGYPGQTGSIELYEIGDGIANVTDLTGNEPTTVFDQQNEEVQINDGDAIRVECAGGGGIGDPLDRDPDAIASDLHEGMIGPEHAYEAYGAVISDGVDSDQTRRRRDQLRSERIESVGDEPRADRACRSCGGDVYRQTTGPDVRGFDIEEGLFELAEYCCGECGLLNDVEVVRVGETGPDRASSE